MLRHSAVLLLAAAVLATSACDDVNSRTAANGPTPFHTQSGLFGVSSSSVVAQPVDNFFCPSRPPFSAHLELIVQADSLDIFVTELRLRFTDVSGLQAPQVTLPAPVMTTQFGSALVAARSARSFPLSFGLGCGTAHIGTIVIFVDTRDALGRVATRQVSVRVR